MSACITVNQTNWRKVILMCTRSTLVVKLPECVDAKQMRAFMRNLRPTLRLDYMDLTLDLSQVQHMDSMGADMLLHCMLEIAKRDGSLKLANVSVAAATVLEVMGLDRLFTMFPSQDESLPEQSKSTPVAETVSEEAVQQPVAA